MQNALQPYRVLLSRLMLLLLIYTCCRILFFVFNLRSFDTLGFPELIKLFVVGLRFDIYAIVITNALFILLHILPVPWFTTNWYQRLIKFIFYAINVPVLLLNAIDFVYFRFSQKRTTVDFFHLFTMGNDIQNNVWQYVFDFWYVLLIVIILIIAVETLYRKAYRINLHTGNNFYLKRTLLLLPAIAIFIIGARGGVQYKPINMQSAARYTTPQFIPLVLNTTFTIIKTLGKDELNDIKYMTQAKADIQFNPHKQLKPLDAFRPLNVVVIILESFSKEYIGYFNNGVGYTPFLDSLIMHSFVCTNAFANGKRSIEGVPAIITSLPALMDEPFISSAYNANSINSIASILKLKGYQSTFFHGGNNGTMGFDNFCRMAGYDRYSGRNEYIGDKVNYDGNWGIFDEPYYQFCVSEMDKMNPPFTTAIFSLSSHHPYTIPSQYVNQFPKGSIPIAESVGYADHSLRTFFNEAATKEWFNNTLFVLTADHTGPAEKPEYQSRTGIYQIPIVFYCPRDSLKGIANTVTQQTDIVPSIMSYLNYDGRYSAFGNNIFDEGSNHFAVNYMNNSYQLINDEWVLQFDGDSATGLYDYKKDATLQQNLLKQNENDARLMQVKLKAIIQQYRQGMLHNKLINR